jgi:hypothetical protein
LNLIDGGKAYSTGTFDVLCSASTDGNADSLG